MRFLKRFRGSKFGRRGVSRRFLKRGRRVGRRISRGGMRF